MASRSHALSGKLETAVHFRSVECRLAPIVRQSLHLCSSCSLFLLFPAKRRGAGRSTRDFVVAPHLSLTLVFADQHASRVSVQQFHGSGLRIEVPKLLTYAAKCVGQFVFRKLFHPTRQLLVVRGWPGSIDAPETADCVEALKKGFHCHCSPPAQENLLRTSVRHALRFVLLAFVAGRVAGTNLRNTHSARTCGKSMTNCAHGNQASM